MEQNAETPAARIEYPKPSYEQLETKLGFVARKSNRRRAALRQVADAFIVQKYHLNALTNDYNDLLGQYNEALAEISDLENELETKADKPWYRFGF